MSNDLMNSLNELINSEEFDEITTFKPMRLQAEQFLKKNSPEVVDFLVELNKQGIVTEVGVCPVCSFLSTEEMELCPICEVSMEYKDK